MTIVRRQDFAQNSLDFPDSASEHVVVSHNAVQNFSAAATWSAWMRIDDFTGESSRAIISKWDLAGPTGNREYIFETVLSGQVGVFIENSGTAGGVIQSLPLHEWMHIAFVYDGSLTGDANRLKGYLNGVQQTLSFTAPGVPATIAATTRPLHLGAFSDPTPVRFFDGRLCQLAAFNVAKNQAGIDALIDKNGKPADLTGQAGLAYWYQLGGINDNLTTINDDSPNSNNGTVTNFSVAEFSRDVP
ncbi:MAG: hypothetical protein GTO22_14505 [Gemmatimonadales bacterium]|nr:hypothetical protein [Gemmatimonadales bacterium]